MRSRIGNVEEFKVRSRIGNVEEFKVRSRFGGFEVRSLFWGVWGAIAFCGRLGCDRFIDSH